MEPPRSWAAWTAAPLAAAALAAGCGGATGPVASVPAGSPAAREWIDNAARLVQQLQRDVTMSATGGSNLASARRAVADDGAVYLLLVAYGDFGDCNRELAAAGTPGAHGRAIAVLILSACRPLEQASALFTRAMQRNDATALLAATRTSATAAPMLVRALAALEALR
jgi:hypothetical protein